MRFARWVLWLSALVWAGFGVLFATRPDLLSGANLVVDDPLARIEIRALYGGLELGIAAFLVWSTRRDERLRSGLMLTAMALGLMALVRLGAIAVEGVSSPLIWGLGAAEAAGAILATVALRRL